MCVEENHSPAMLILAGVAFRDAGVLVRLLLLGVMPLAGEKMLDNNLQYVSTVVIYTVNNR